MSATLTSTPFIVCAAVLGVAIIAAWATDVSRYIPEARRILTGQANTGQHAVHGKRSHAKVSQRDRTDPFAGLDDPADPDRAADDYIAALHEEPRPVPVLAAPVPEALEALPPLDQRTRPAFVIAAPWEPPVSRGDLSSVRDALKAWNPAPAVPQEPEPEPVTAGDDTGEIFLNLVGGDWDPAEMVRRIERSVYGDSAPESGSEDKAAFAGTSLPGLPGWDFTLPVVALPGGTVPAGSEESAA